MVGVLLVRAPVSTLGGCCCHFACALPKLPVLAAMPTCVLMIGSLGWGCCIHCSLQPWGFMHGNLCLLGYCYSVIWWSRCRFGIGVLDCPGALRHGAGAGTQGRVACRVMCWLGEPVVLPL
jgi:hypothetical protein